MGHTKPTCVNDAQWGQVTGVRRVLCVTDMKVVLISFSSHSVRGKKKHFPKCETVRLLRLNAVPALSSACQILPTGSANAASIQKTKLYPPALFLCDSCDIPLFFSFFFLLCWVTGRQLALYTIFIAMWEGQRMVVTSLLNFGPLHNRWGKCKRS